MLAKAFGYQVCPEPSSYIMAAIGAAGVIGAQQFRRRRKAA
ncbi:MAG: PEP-CTERM sorting domain-containing protein [Isosphaeraceae bacterium]